MDDVNKGEVRWELMERDWSDEEVEAMYEDELEEEEIK